MTTTLAIRNRPFSDPHPISSLQASAIAKRDLLFSERRTAISRLVRENPTNPDEFYWTMVYDMQQAPTLTARSRLLEAGIIPVPPQELTTDTELHDELWTVLEALSTFGLFLFNTNHLCDRDLYCRLYFKILDEETRLLPPSAEAVELIDCLHPLDIAYTLGKMQSKNPTIPQSFYDEATTSYSRGPLFPQPGTLNDRDRHLPRPSSA